LGCRHTAKIRKENSYFAALTIKMISSTRIYFFLASGLLSLSLSATGQETEKRISPLAMTTARYKDSYIKVTYGQPGKKKREIFGKLVPYGQVWRTGANEATEITLTQDISILGKAIPAGTYSLYSIPNPTQWTIILNKEVGVWGSYNYNPKSDVARWDVPVKKLEGKSIEWLSIQLDTKNNLADLNICWDDICVTLPIQFNEPKQ
jgi:predicted HTH domain antitoxin